MNETTRVRKAISHLNLDRLWWVKDQEYRDAITGYIRRLYEVD